MTRFEIRRQHDGGATVFAIEPVWLANFRDHADAEAFVRMRQANDDHAALMAEEAALKAMLTKTAAGEAAEIAIDPVPRDGHSDFIVETRLMHGMLKLGFER